MREIGSFPEPKILVYYICTLGISYAPAFAADFLPEMPEFLTRTPQKFRHLRQKILSQIQVQRDSESTLYIKNEKERLPQFRKILQKRRHSRLRPAVPDMLQYFTGVL